MADLKGPVAPQIGTPVVNPDGEKPPSTVVKGMLLMSFAMLVLPIMDGIAKVLSTHYDVTAAQITFGRFLVQASLLALIIPVFLGIKFLLARHWLVNLIRGAIMGTAVLLFFATLRYMPIADAIAVFFVEPFILTLMSIVFLKEKVGWRRLVAVVIGFGGAMLIVQPSYEVFGAVSLMPIGTAFLFATYLLVTRKFGGDDNPLSMQFLAGVGGTIAMVAIMIIGNNFGVADISSPEIPEFGIRWLLIFAIGVLATGGHLVVVMAFRLADASILAPFQYIEIVGATALGFWLFGDFPDAWKWLGIAIIIGSGIYIFMRERKVG